MRVLAYDTNKKFLPQRPKAQRIILRGGFPLRLCAFAGETLSMRTEGIKYAGSKLKLLPHILGLAARVEPRTVFDGFSGTTRVSQAFAQCGYRVIANDIAVWSKVFGDCYLLSPHPALHYENLIDHLNSLPGKHGWFTEHYAGDTTS